MLVDKMAKYGTWEWAIYTIESEANPVKHYSEWWTIYKDPPELLTPGDGVVVDKYTQFAWNKVASADAEHTWYIAKLTGYTPLDPLYVWWPNADKATLPPNWHQILKNIGGGEFTWTIAAVSGDPSTPDGKGMTYKYAEKVKYPAARTFYVE
jgi:hypothetical protein